MVGDGEQQKVGFYRQHRWPSGRCHQCQAARLPPLSPHVPILEHASLFAREQAEAHTGGHWGSLGTQGLESDISDSDCF